MFCRQCLYPLDGLPESRCPECGRGFNPAEEESFLNKPSYPPSRASVAAILCVLVDTAVLLTAVFFFWGRSRVLDCIRGHLAISVTAVVCAAVGLVRSHTRNSLGWIALAVACLLALFLVLALVPVHL